MTTATRQTPLLSGMRPLGGAALVALLAGGAVTAVAALVSGSQAASAAALGAAIAVVVFLAGSVSVNAVAGLMPAASLLVALLTYTLQVLVVVVVLAGLSEVEALSGEAPRAGLAAGVIVVTLVWSAAHVWLASRQRTLAYELGTVSAETASAPRTTAGPR